jgi:hypothetical protein
VIGARASALAAALALGACAAPPEPDPPPPVAAPAGPSCAAALEAAGARWEPEADRIGPGRCRLVEAVRLAHGRAALDQPLPLACAMAERWLEFERDVLAPAAERHFGAAPARVRVFAGYSCRTRPNSRVISQHAFGNAIDIAGFDLAGGTRIDVGRHWRDRGARGAFLREVARGACRLFAVVLTPDSDAHHQDHFHFDIGPDRRCDA